MKDWRYIQAQMPQRHDPEASVTAGFNLDILQILLAGLYFLLGLSGHNRTVVREQALRLRRAATETAQVRRSLDNADNHITAWSADDGRHWRKRLLALSVDPHAPDIIFKSRNIVTRLRNASARTLRPKHHSHSFLVMQVLTAVCQTIVLCVRPLFTVALRSARYDMGVRAPP